MLIVKRATTEYSLRYLFGSLESLYLYKSKRRERLFWKKFQWSKWGWVNRKTAKKTLPLLQVFWWSRQYLILNFFEMHYRICVGILIRKPRLGEVLLARKKRWLAVGLLKKIYFLY